jgi:hypothetical protein
LLYNEDLHNLKSTNIIREIKMEKDVVQVEVMGNGYKILVRNPDRRN